MPAVEHLVDDVGGGDRAERVEDRLPPGRHLLRLAAGQVAELLAADGEQRPEDDDLLVLAALEHGLETGAQGQRRLAGAGPATERDDADLGVEQQVEGDALLGRPAVDAEGLPVTADEVDALVGLDPPEGTPPLGHQHQAGVARQLPGLVDVDDLVVVEVVEVGTGDVQLLSCRSSRRRTRGSAHCGTPPHRARPPRP